MATKFRNLLVDFDGTVIDSAPGVQESIEFTLRQFGLEIPGREKLRQCIGPGIQQGLRLLAPGRDDDFINQCVGVFRAHYDSEGFKGSYLYPGITDLLKGLRGAGYKIYLASMKAQSGVDSIVPYLGIRDLFEEAFGSDPWGPIRYKHEFIADLLKRKALNPDETAIIGDTRHDIEAGKHNGIFTIGILYGFGSEDELRKAGADMICPTVRNLAEFFGLGE